MASFPTVVPSADIQQDQLKQFDDAVQQSNLDAFDQMSSDSLGALQSIQPPPANSLTPGDPAAAATAKAVSAGADPADLTAARQQMGSQAYNKYCEKFVENASGKDGQYASALNAWQQQPGQQQTDLSQIRPGDLVYYGPASENSGYGHAAIYSGNGKIISATSNGVKETPAQGYFNAPLLGYLPAGDNDHLPPSPMAGGNQAGTFSGMPQGELAGVPAHATSTDDQLSLLDREASKGQSAVESFLNGAGQQISNLGSTVQNVMSGATGLNPTQPVTSDNHVNAAGGSLQDYARQAAAKYGVDPDIFVRQIQQESGFNPSAQSPAGAIGIAQFMPDTAKGMGVDPTDPQQALDGAARMMAQSLQKYGGDYSKALAAYNAGGGAVDKYGGVPPFQETQNYVKSILGAAGQKMSELGSGVQDAATGLRTSMGAGDNVQPNPALTVPPSQQTLGDVANVMGTASTPISDAAAVLNPKNIGNAAAQAVLDAEGKPMQPEQSFPVVTGASDLASSLTQPGGVLPKAGELAAGAKAAPSLADALRAAADHLEGKGIGVVGPSMGATAPGDVVAGVGVNPAPLVQAAGDAAGGMGYELNRLLAPAKNTPPEVQGILRDFANVAAAPGMGADVRAESLAKKVQDVLGADDNVAAAIHFEKTGEFVPNPTPEQAALAEEVRNFINDTGQAGREAGFIRGDVTQAAPGASNLMSRDMADFAAAARNETAHTGASPEMYFPHIYQDSAEQAQALAKSAGGLNPRDFYSNQRVYPTLEEAMANGKTPVDSVSGPLQTYAGKVLDSQAKADLVYRLKTSGAAMDMPKAPEPIVGFNPNDITKSPPPPLPDGWVAGASIAPQLNSIAVTHPVAEALRNVLGSGFENAPVIGGATQALGAAKENLFSLSGFHLGTELRQAYRAGGPIAGTQVAAKTIWNAVNPAAFDSFRLANAEAFDKWAGQGVTGLVGRRVGPDASAAGVAIKSVVSGAEGAALGGGAATQAGMSDQDRLKAALIGGAAGAVLGPTLGTQFSKALWERAVPTLKVATAELLGQKYAPDAVATFVNQTYGGQNLAAIARSKTVQGVVRLATLSPDWWEGWARQLGSAALPNDLGGMARKYWLRTATIDGAFGLEGMNKAINGHFTNKNEPGREFDLEITGLVGKDAMGNRQYLDVLGPLKSIVQLATSPVMPGSGGLGQFVSSRIGLAPSLGLAAITNQDYAKQPIVPTGTPPQVAGPLFLDAAMQRLAPIGGQQVSQLLTRTTTSPDLPQGQAPGATVGETAGTILTGMRTSAGPAPSVLYNQRDQGLADLQSHNGDLFSAYKTAGRPIDQPPASYKQIMFSPAEQLAFQQARIGTLKTMFKPGEWQQVMALKPGDRDAVLGKLLDMADRAAAGQVAGAIGNDQVNQRIAQRNVLGRQGGRAEAMREMPTFTAPATS